jgi:hypothetical protein
LTWIVADLTVRSVLTKLLDRDPGALLKVASDGEGS